MTPIPITLLTGFLGSGKTTLVSRILSDSRFADTAVIVNEFGDIGLDSGLIAHSSEQLVEMTTGCLCCTIRGNIRETLLDLAARRSAGTVPQFARLIVETTGLADPAPVIHTLIVDPDVCARYMLGGGVTTVDAINGLSTLDRQIECVKQIAVADRLVLTKRDLAENDSVSPELPDLVERIARLNPGALLLDANDAGFDLRRLFDTALYDPSTRTLDVQRWLNAEALDTSHGHNHANHSHAHDVNRHSDDIRAFVITFDEPIATMSFTIALEMLLASHGENLLRIKGIVHLLETPDKPAVLHGVQHIFHEPVWLEGWPSEDRRTTLVFITRHIGKETITDYFDAWRRLQSDTMQSDLPVIRDDYAG